MYQSVDCMMHGSRLSTPPAASLFVVAGTPAFQGAGCRVRRLGG
jgi:hypothetical protein